MILKVLGRVLKSIIPLISKTDPRDYPAFSKLAFGIMLYRIRKIFKVKQPDVVSTPLRTIPIRIDNVRFEVPPHPGDFGFIFECLLEHTYERDPRFIPQNGWTCLDVGANIGACSARWRKHNSDGRIFCFEPHPVTFKRLSRNVELNGWTKTTCLNAAISASSGELKMGLQLTQAKVGADESTSAHCVTVPAYSLSDFIRREKLGTIQLCKIDVEGHEVEVLNGGLEFLPVIERIIMEYHSPELQAKVRAILERDFIVISQDLTAAGLMFFINKKLI